MTRRPSSEARDGLVAGYKRYVNHIVGALIKALNLPQELFDDFVAAGYLGLVEAASRFDFESGSDFKSYAYLRIRGAVIDSIRETSELSGRAYRFSKALQAAQELRERLITDRAAEVETKDEQDKLASVLEYAAKGALAFRLSLYEAESEVTAIEDESANPETNMENREELGKLRELIKDLPLKERIVLEGYYLQEKSFSQIAAENEGMSKSWVSRLHDRGLSLLKELYVASLEV